MFDFPDGLIPWGTFHAVSPVPSPFECLLVSLEVERDILLFSLPFLFKSCLFRGPLTTISMFSSLLVSFPVPLGFPLAFPLRAAAP